MLHLHFGAGRLGLGLAAPFFQKPGDELLLFNRLNSSPNPTGDAGLPPSRKIELLKNHPKHQYVIQSPKRTKILEKVHYTNFSPYQDSTVEETISTAIRDTAARQEGVVVTASVVNHSNYVSIVKALNVLSRMRHRQKDIGNIFLVACENTVSAQEVLTGELSVLVEDHAREHVHCVDALVDRMCVALEEYIDGDGAGSQPTVAVRAEEYGSLKLDLRPEIEELVDLCRGSRVEFSKHLETEKKIKGWLLNGTHWLIALDAFNATGGDTEVKLNEYLNSSPERRQFAIDVMTDMRDGVEALLLTNPKYADFARDISPGAYVDGAAQAILRRFMTTDDTLGRILARLRKPTPEQYMSLQSFIQRFLSRVDPALKAYEITRQKLPVAATKGKLSLGELIASGTFVDGKLKA
jgi:hypothetical protein